MSENKDIKTALPKLRFPEFVNDKNWTCKTISNIAEIKGRIGYRGYTTNDITNKGNGAIAISPSNICDDNSLNFDKATYITWDKYEESPEIMVEVGYTLLVKTASVGKTAYVKYLPEKATINPQLVVLKPICINDVYLSYVIAHPNTQKQITDNIGAGAIPNMSQNSISKILAIIPEDLDEQTKIAECLSSLDDAINGVGDKIEALKEYKKGLMQQLFPSDGKTTPAFRFPEFKSDKPWDMDSQFSKYIKLYRGSSPRPIKQYLTNDDDGVNWIKIGDTKNAVNYTIDFVEEKITPAGSLKSRYVNIGELILANSMSFGKTYQLNVEGCIYDGWFVLREYEEFFDKQFLLQLLNSDYMQSQYKRLSAGGIVQNISSDIVYQTIMPHTSKEEQIKIAKCLSSIDNLITSECDKLFQLKEHKKGLMQQLFPNLNE